MSELPKDRERTENAAADAPDIRKVMVTGATGFVGRSIVRELVSRGFTPVCLVRSPDTLRRQHPDIAPDQMLPVIGSLQDRGALQHAADLSQAVIHLVGIIIARSLQGKTFEKLHVKGTRHVLDAVERAGIKRYVHMSALGTRPDAASTYHRTKWEAEEDVRSRDLDSTIFRPSLIHGPDGEFMRLIKAFVCGIVPPVIPYFGDGQARIQPVSVKDVAYCFVESLFRVQTIRKLYPLGGPRSYSWLQLYETCRRIMPGARRYKPYVSLPPGLAKVIAGISAPPMALAELIVPRLGMFRFDRGQVTMAGEDATCDPSIVEEAFGIRLRSFESELTAYADGIR